MNIDAAIFIGFLVVNLLVGIFYSRGIKNIKEYAIGNRNFSTGTIAATLIATWIAGSSLTIKVSETYSQGLYFIAANLADPFCFIIIGYFFAPRMAEFLGKISVAEVMGDLYGNKVRLITVISAVGVSVGYVGLQIKVMSALLDYFFSIGSLPALLITVLVTVLYSAIGGIKAVTFTDTIQLFTFGVFIPSIALIIWGTMHDPDLVSSTLFTNKLFDYNEFFSLDNPKFFSWLVLFLYCLLPSLDPAIFQRISMATNTKQVRKAFLVAACFIMLLCLIMYFIGILLLSVNGNLNSSNIIGYIVDNYSYTGLKGLTIVGILAMGMSTADSYVNSSAILLSYDLPKALGIQISERKQLLWSRVCALAIGILSLIPALLAKNLLQMLVIMANFYMPVVSIPLILAIFGFRSTTKAVLIGMFSGVATVIIFNYLKIDIDSVIPGMAANLIGFVSSHYLLRQSGGWVGIKDQSLLITARLERRKKFQKLINYLKNFNLLIACKNNSPNQESTYTLFGLFGIISVFSTMYSISPEMQHQHAQLLAIVYHTILVSSTILLSYPIWPLTFKQEKFITVLWNIAVPYILIFAPALLIIVSNFGQFQLMILMINIIVMSILLRWQVAILMIPIALSLSIQFYKWFVGIDSISSMINIGLQFKIMYLLLLVSSVLIVFLKPKQDQQELTEEKNEYLVGRIDSQEKQLQEALALKGEFIRNVSHEYHAPMMGVISLAQVLAESYDHLTDNQRKKAAEDIYKSSIRLESFDANITSLSRLSKGGNKLQLKQIDLGKLLNDRIEICRKLYEENKEDREFVLDIDEGVMLDGDEYYLTQTLDNLIINSITYCQKGKINITLKRNTNEVTCLIQDEGIGIPVEELKDIFSEFVISSKTRSTAGGRGVGLALCKRVIELHRGKIWAESNGQNGAVFYFTIPTNR